MRVLPFRLLLALLGAGVLLCGLLTSQPVLVLAGVMAAALLALHFSRLRQPVPQALQRFQNQSVTVLVWGAPPPGSAPDPELAVESVNVIGAGLHIFFATRGGASIHLKVAQPRANDITPERVVLGGARYVQWAGHKIPRVQGAPALSVVLDKKSG
jgi:hypothetical protein